MNNFYDAIDKVDFTSILNEETISGDTKFCRNCFNEFTGEGDYCEFCSKQLNEEIPENVKLLLQAVSSFEDNLPYYGYSDPTELSYEEQEELLTSVLNDTFGEGAWSKDDFNSVARELGIFGIIKENVEEDITDLQSALSQLKQGIEGLDKTNDVSGEDTFEFRGVKYTREKAQKEIDKIEKDLANLNQDKVDDLDNAFGDSTFEEPAEPVEEPEVAEPVEVVDNVIDPTNGDAEGAEDGVESGIIDGIDPLSDTELSDSSEPKEDSDTTEDEKLDEAIQTITTVDNIDQESKDKATIDKAIELAGSKDTIDNDTFRALRLALANKDYDVIDRLKDYALVRGEDVIYVWLRAEDANLKESVKSSKLFLREGVDCKALVVEEEEYTFDEIILDMSNATEYSELYSAADKIINDELRAKVEELIGTCEDDGDDVEVAYSIVTSDILDGYSNEINEDLQVSDVPAKDDQGKPGKRLELAKLENEGSTTYRISYLKEDDEIMGWDVDVDSDEKALDTLDKFDSSSDTIDDISNLEFTDTPIGGVSSASYNGVDLALSTAEDGNALLTITTQEGMPVLLKGENLNDILTKLVYWFIMGIEE